MTRLIALALHVPVPLAVALSDADTNDLIRWGLTGLCAAIVYLGKGAIDELKDRLKAVEARVTDAEKLAAAATTRIAVLESRADAKE